MHLYQYIGELTSRIATKMQYSYATSVYPVVEPSKLHFVRVLNYILIHLRSCRKYSVNIDNGYMRNYKHVAAKINFKHCPICAVVHCFVIHVI